MPGPLRILILAVFVDHHLKTGFLGTAWLLPALSSIDRDDLAMRLLLSDDYPSWGFEIRVGATTVWERWKDGVLSLSVGSGHYEDHIRP
jgi:hypothetical protein